jgi:hypothetical protein
MYKQVGDNFYFGMSEQEEGDTKESTYGRHRNNPKGDEVDKSACCQSWGCNPPVDSFRKRV